MEEKFLNILKNKHINITEENILERFLDKFRWPKIYPWGQPSVEAILEDGTKHQNFFNNDGYLNSEECIKCYEAGYTLILSNIGGFSKDLWTIQQILNYQFGKNINMNFYFGNGKKSISFEKHYHPYAVIVKNVYGSSKWIISEEEKVLENQDVIWFDKFINHQVVEINTPKLSLTCNIDI
jgi:hypothetical protein